MPKLSDIASAPREVKMVPNGHAGEEEPQLIAKPAPIAKVKPRFDGDICCIGLGSVWECMFPLLVKHLDLDLTKVVLVDMLDRRKVIQQWIDAGCRFEQEQVLPENFEAFMEDHFEPGDLCIDLAYDISCVEILQWCRDNEVLYINTSIEEWDFTDGFDKRDAEEKSLYARRQEIDAIMHEWTGGEATAVLEYGANPGLISAFAKQGIRDLAKKKKVEFNGDYAELARKLKVKVMIDTERDTQRMTRPRESGEFVGTWSCCGLLEEATSPAELGWGTHEGKPPVDATVPDHGPKNQIFLHTMGMNTRVRGFVPPPHDADYADEVGDNKTEPISADGQIMGVLIRHGEAYTISDFFTTEDGKYRPTVYYCYMPCDATQASLQELRANDYKPLCQQRIAYENEIEYGSDVLGIMIGGYDDEHVWWCGSSLCIEDARKLIPLQNATSIQVAIGFTAAICYAIENPNEGVINPEDIPEEYILKIAKPYLGEFISKEYSWTPVDNNTNYFPERKECDPDEKNIWKFANFLDRQ
jgi:homospermidine synthase